MIRLWSTLVVALCTVAVGQAQPDPAEEKALAEVRIVGEVPPAGQTAKRLGEAQQLAEAGKTNEAVDAYLRLMLEAGDELVPVTRRQSVQVRRLCQERLAGLPPAGLRLYRLRVESQAKGWLDQGLAGDKAALERLAEQAFCSRHTDQALDLLGDLSFERGNFDEAQHWWGMLVRPLLDADGIRPGRGLRYPDPKVDVVRIQAKILLARLFQGERSEAFRKQCTAFVDQYPKTEGRLAGRNGKYADILESFLRQADALAPPADEEAWASLGGDATRNYRPRVQGRLAHLPQNLERSHWMVRLDTGKQAKWEEESRRIASAVSMGTATEIARHATYYPVLSGNWVLTADARYVRAYDLISGKQAVPFDLYEHEKVKRSGSPVYGGESLTVEGGRVYARMHVEDSSLNRSYLVCLALPAGPQGKLEPVWVLPSKGFGSAGPNFDGAPLVSHERLYVAESRSAAGQTQTAISCYDSESQRLHWQRTVCETPEPRSGDRPPPHQLLTQAGASVVYCSHTGAILALDARTGRPAWAARYPSRGPRTREGLLPPRNSLPCLYAEGRVFAAPIDYDRILCLDAVTGAELWKNQEPLEVVHLLGVAGNRLFVSATTPYPCLRALEASTGRDVPDWLKPESNDGNELRTFGRGLLAGNRVFWPTQNKLYVFDQESGALANADSPIFRGNLAAANGCLAAASLEHLFVYVPEGRLLSLRQEEAARDKGSPLAHYRLAVAQADAGLLNEAIVEFQRVEKMPGSESLWQREPLREWARRGRFEALFELASRSQSRPEEAKAYLQRAAGTEFSAGERLKSLSRLADLWTAANRPARAIAVWQGLLEDSDLSLALTDSDGLPLAGAAWATEKIEQLIQAHGRAQYSAIEEQARALYARAIGAKQTEILERLGRTFPNAEITKVGLLELARVSQMAGKPATAAQAYRQLLQRSGSPEQRAVLLAGLARTYEQQQCWQAARRIWQRLVSEQGGRVVIELDPVLPVRDWVSQHLQDPKYQPAPAPHLSPPLLRTWQTVEEPAPDRSFLISDGGVACFVTVRGNTVSYRESSAGRCCWQQLLAFSPQWIGRSADLMLLGGANRIDALRRADGAPVWSYSVPDMPGVPYVSGSPPDPGSLTGFQVYGNLCFFLQGKRRLIAFDAESGRVLWGRWGPGGPSPLANQGGCFLPHYLAVSDRLIVQTNKGSCLVLDSHTGRTLHQALAARTPWAPPLPFDEHKIILSPEPGRVALLDTQSGKELWSHPIEFPTSLTGETTHLLLGGDALVVLFTRNYGYFVECLDPQSGQPRWPQARFVGVKRPDLPGAAIREGTLYFVQGSFLTALNLVSGKPLWQEPLPSQQSRWQIQSTRDALLVYPRESRAVHGQVGWLFGRLLFQLPLPWEEQGRSGYPVLILDPLTGRLGQRLNFPVEPPPAKVQLRLAATPIPFPIIEVLTDSAPGSVPRFQFSNRGLTALTATGAWGLTATD
jgi:outer membrane protein assembly factor BamB